MHVTPTRSCDRHAEFTGLLGPLLDAAYRMALHLARNPADAEDLLQDAALLAFRHFDQFRAGTNFRAWFFRILLNRFYSRYRRRDARITFDDQVAATAPVHEGPEGFFSRVARPDAQLLARVDADAITAAIGGLPDDFRAVCTLYLVQDLSYKEIAALLDVPVGTVRSRLHRGRRLLQRALSGLAAERGIIQDATPYQERDDAAR
ncbi:MAG TPA: sigma-70 family RNA polymerase sigma factor [Gemmatirosa sp.]|nr:sigma-70 family RNA polymerase sigma factor [Gemmatirosa sp.]